MRFLTSRTIEFLQQEAAKHAVAAFRNLFSTPIAELLTKACCASQGGLQAPPGRVQGDASHRLAHRRKLVSW
eukprot:1646271-Amphidinium_carterae.3